MRMNGRKQDQLESVALGAVTAKPAVAPGAAAVAPAAAPKVINCTSCDMVFATEKLRAAHELTHGDEVPAETSSTSKQPIKKKAPDQKKSDEWSS